MQKIAIIGSGMMGSGIAQVAATSKQEVFLIDKTDDILASAMRNIASNVGKAAEKGKLTESPADILKRIKTTTDIAAGVKDVDFVIEAVFEDLDLKKEIFARIDSSAPKRAIMATNTSSLPITAIGRATKRPQNAIGMHWFLPPQVMKLVEVVKSKSTDAQTLQSTLALCTRYNKEPVLVQKDVWFFLAVRAKFGLSFEANLMHLNKQADFKDIDASIRYKLGLPMGEFELMDLTGAVEIRTRSLASVERVLKLYNDFEPSSTFISLFRYLTDKLWGPMYDRGLSGVKSGQGFYNYPSPGKYAKPEISADLAGKINILEYLAPAINLVASCVADGIGTVGDINKAFKLAYGWPKGIFDYINEYGTANIIAVLKDKGEEAPDWLKGFYKPSELITSWK